MIPFCEFGGKLVGVRIDQFPIRVCNIFWPKNMQDQLCYTVDPNQYINVSKEELSLSLFIHYNEDRQMEDSESLDEDSKISVGTIGKFLLI